MKKTSLLAHIVHGYCSQVENIASDSLHFILENSPSVRKAFFSYLETFRIDLPSSAKIRKQIQDVDRNQPDLSVYEDGKPLVYLEAKFGASLTDNQPVGYWNQLSKNSNGLLLFIVPKRRVNDLWKELVDRLHSVEADLDEQENKVSLHHHPFLKIMAITSWEELLDILVAGVDEKSEKEAASDLYQLKMLCLDSDILAMGAVKVETYDGPYHQYVDAVDDWLRTECTGFASKHRLTTGKGIDYYAQYILLHGIICGIIYHASWQLKYEDTQLWLWIDKTMITREKLHQLEIHTENAGFITPLWIQPEAVFTENLNSLKEQILNITQRFA